MNLTLGEVVPQEVLRESLGAKLMNVALLRGNLQEAFEGVVDHTVELKFVAMEAKISFKDELAAIEVNIGRAFEDQYLELKVEDAPSAKVNLYY